MIRIGLETGQNWRDVARWNNLENPNLIEVGQVLRVVPPGVDAAMAVDQPVTTAKVEPRPLESPAARLGAARASPAARAPAPSRRPSPPRWPPPPATPCQPRATATTMINWAWPAAGPCWPASTKHEQGHGYRRQARRPGACRGRRPGGLCGLWPARLRQPRHPEAQRHLPDRLRAQPDPAGEGRPGGRRGQKIAEMGRQRRRPGAAALRDPRQGKPVDPARLLPPR